MADNKNSGTLLAAGLTCLVGGGIGGGFSLAGAEVPVLDSIALQIPLVLLGILLLFASGQFDRMVLIGISVVGLALPIAHLLADGAGDGDVDGPESGSAITTTTTTVSVPDANGENLSTTSSVTTSTTSPETTSSTSDDTQPPTGPDLDAASSLAKVAEIPASNVLAAHAGTMRAAQSTGSSIVLVDLLSGDIISTFTTGGRQVTAAAFNSSGRLLATGSADSSVLIWDLRSEQVIATVSVNTEGVDEMEFSAEASRFAVSSDAPIAGAVSLYDSDDWSVVAEVEPPGENTVDLAFTRDGSRLLIATWFEGFGDLAVLDTAGGELLGQFSDDSDPLASADIAADDRTVAGGFEDGLIRFFDLLTRRGTGDELDDHRIEGCEDGFNNCGGLSRVRFSPDGTVLVSGDREGRVFVWDVSAKALVTSLDGHGDRIAEIEFARSGAVLTVVTVDTSRVLVWSGKG